MISVHGSLETANPARPGEVIAKILVCHGAIDGRVPTKQVTGFIDEMNAARIDYQLIVYGGAMHGFTHDGVWSVAHAGGAPPQKQSLSCRRRWRR